MSDMRVFWVWAAFVLAIFVAACLGNQLRDHVAYPLYLWARRVWRMTGVSARKLASCLVLVAVVVFTWSVIIILAVIGVHLVRR